MRNVLLYGLLLFVAAGCNTTLEDTTESSETPAVAAIEEDVQEAVEEHSESEALEEQEVTQEINLFENTEYGSVFPLKLTVPVEWDVEYIPEIESLNVYTRDGEGKPIDRSQLFIRYFDAADFLTLSTVTIYSTTDRTVGAEEYTARQYDIEKKPGVADFPAQPVWRNERHLVTDFPAEDGYTRYYVVAANPELDSQVYEAVLSSLQVQ